ncbi:hypothetical protein BDK51DRAFT_26629 [Blyttiomyces helicus]|uniref:Uncharacterized protein n=1 Tax=Blyttiomyces helicus TaxID=388810 RepID=A0A4P9W6S0_9FUNG|nr:hypothetical protein BDK51DRAFT_26629 [Blyttiomyces helicus]|eukprot:RKO87075.1 hypothetical protein BDK51DRAFT_26629 [Blyttiomyces helicus]
MIPTFSFPGLYSLLKRFNYIVAIETEAKFETSDTDPYRLDFHMHDTGTLLWSDDPYSDLPPGTLAQLERRYALFANSDLGPAAHATPKLGGNFTGSPPRWMSTLNIALGSRSTEGWEFHLSPKEQAYLKLNCLKMRAIHTPPEGDPHINIFMGTVPIPAGRILSFPTPFNTRSRISLTPPLARPRALRQHHAKVSPSSSSTHTRPSRPLP